MNKSNFKQGQKAKSMAIILGPFTVIIRKLTLPWYDCEYYNCDRCKRRINIGDLYGAGRYHKFCLNCLIGEKK